MTVTRIRCTCDHAAVSVGVWAWWPSFSGKLRNLISSCLSFQCCERTWALLAKHSFVRPNLLILVAVHRITHHIAFKPYSTSITAERLPVILANKRLLSTACGYLRLLRDGFHPIILEALFLHRSGSFKSTFIDQSWQCMARSKLITARQKKPKLSFNCNHVGKVFSNRQTCIRACYGLIRSLYHRMSTSWLHNG